MKISSVLILKNGVSSTETANSLFPEYDKIHLRLKFPYKNSTYEFRVYRESNYIRLRIEGI